MEYLFERYEKIATSRNSITEIQNIFEELKATIPMSDVQFHNIYICATEAFNNAIIHGNKLNSAKFIELHVRAIDNFVYVDVVDEGDGFNEDALEDPLEKNNLSKESGRGIFIIDHFCTKKELKKTQRGFCVSLSFDISNKK